MRIQLIAAIGLAIALAAPTVTIATKQNTDRERRTKAQLEKVLQDYDLTKYLFTRDVRIEDLHDEARIKALVEQNHLSLK